MATRGGVGKGRAVEISHYKSGVCDVEGLEPLVAALLEMGYKPEIHKEAQPLFGFQGDMREQKAHVIIRRDQVGGSSNDVGFLLRPDKKVEWIISEFDAKGSHRFGDAKLAELRRLSGIHGMIQKAKAKGHKVQRFVDPQGKTRVRVYA